MGTELTWRLEGGYSRFIEGSQVELRLEKKPFRHSLDVSPSGLVHRSQPIDLIFRVTRGSQEGDREMCDGVSVPRARFVR